MFLYCRAAQLATDNLVRFADEVFDSAWYELPNNIQKSYILIIANAEIPICYDGLHMVYLNLPTFSRVSVFLAKFLSQIFKYHIFSYGIECSGKIL